MTKISQYTTMTTLQNGDLLDISEDLGAGSYGSRSLTYANLLTNLTNDLACCHALGLANQVPTTNPGATDFDYSANFTFNGTILQLTGTLVLPNENEIRLLSAGATYNAFKSPGVIPVSKTYTLPATTPTSNGQVLASTTLGVMTWEDNLTPIVLYADDLAELTAAFNTLNGAGIAGIVKLGGQINLVADLTLDFGTGIELHGGSNAISNAGTFKIVATGDKFTFYNVIFRGTNDFNNGVTPETTPSQAMIEVDMAGGRGVFLDCEFQDIIGGVNGTNTTVATAPIQITDCDVFSRFIFSNVWITTKETAPTNHKPYAPLSVLWNAVGKTGTVFNCDNWALSAMTTKAVVSPNANEPWINYQSAMKILVTGAPPLSYSTITVDQSMTVDSATTAGWYKYPTMWGPNLILENVNPTQTDTEGVESDILINGSDIYMKHTDIAPNGGNKNWHNLTHKSVEHSIASTYPLTYPADCNKCIDFTHPVLSTVTIPLNATEAFPIGTEVTVAKFGAGDVRISPIAGATLNYAGGSGTYIIQLQYQNVTLKKVATDTWWISGSNYLG